MTGEVAPRVTVILPTRNERHYIRDCLDSLLAQDYPSLDEILVVDGASADGTVQLAESVDPRVRVIHNPRLTAAAAMNLGLRHARNDLIVRADAHTLYAPVYVCRSVEALAGSGASWVGGPMRPVGLTVFGRAVAAVTSSPLGIGPGRFHYADAAQDVETVYLGAFNRAVVWEVGGYDEDDLQWAAEDQELAYRLRLAGHRIRLDPRIRSWYFPRQELTPLARQYFNYGLCKASTLKKHRTLPYWRPLAPAAMVGGGLAWTTLFTVLRRYRLVSLPALAYMTAAVAVGVHLGRAPGVAPHRATLALTTCHWAYGLGFWAGVVRILRRRPFDNVPRKR